MPSPRLTTCVWFERDGEAAARRYVSLIPGSSLGRMSRAAADFPGGVAGDLLTIEFTLAGHSLLALNGGQPAPHSHAMSLSVECDDQAELDRIWDGLLEGGGAPMQCGWLKDPWGVPWQVVPRALPTMLADPDRAAAARAMTAMMGMVKLDIAALEAAFRAG